MQILVSGASGLIGSHLVPVLESKGHHVVRLVRRPTGSQSEIVWNPNMVPPLTGFDSVIHLAGETIMGRWTPQKKARILESRTVGTRNLSAALAAAAARPQTRSSPRAVRRDTISFPKLAAHGRRQRTARARPASG